MSEQFDSPEFAVPEIEEEEEEVLFDDEFDIEENFLEGDERTVTIRTSGATEVVPWREGMTLEDAFNDTNLVMRARTDFYLDNAIIEMSTVLPAGAVITAIGATQKGG
jgi:hypothetical protein